MKEYALLKKRIEERNEVLNIRNMSEKATMLYRLANESNDENTEQYING